MIYLKEAVIVEGKYDKIKLKNFISAEIITTDGFRIFKDRQKTEMIRRIAEKRGIIILTDSDAAGFVIRGHLNGIIDQKYIKNVFVPEIKGKERRKAVASSAGLLGVEGLSEQIISDALKRAGIGENTEDRQSIVPKITKADLFAAGLSGGEGSRFKREQLLKKLKLPTGMSSAQMLTALNSLYTEEEFLAVCRKESDVENRSNENATAEGCGNIKE